jgi:hypothetical protein
MVGARGRVFGHAVGRWDAAAAAGLEGVNFVALGVGELDSGAVEFADICSVYSAAEAAHPSKVPLPQCLDVNTAGDRYLAEKPLTALVDTQSVVAAVDSALHSVATKSLVEAKRHSDK